MAAQKRIRKYKMRIRTEYQRRWRHENHHKALNASNKWRAAHRDVLRVQSMLRAAVRKGVVDRLDHCEICGLVCSTQGHHRDYSKPLEVVWLCPSCHRKAHRA